MSYNLINKVIFYILVTRKFIHKNNSSLHRIEKERDYVDGIDSDLVMQFHLAGHSYNGEMIIDTHDHDVCHSIWKLYEYALQRFSVVSTMIERDDNIPEFAELWQELTITEKIAANTLPPEQLKITANHSKSHDAGWRLMNDLRDLQQNFMHYLLRKPSDMVEHIESTPVMSESDRLDIYGSAYNLRLKEAITTDYDKLHGYLGDEQFDQLMDCYIEKYPSHTTNLRYFSINMSDLLQEQAPFNQFPVLAELARIEFSFANSFDAENTYITTINDLAVIDPEQWATLQFEFQKSVALLTINTNSFAIWKALANEETPPKVEHLEIAAN